MCGNPEGEELIFLFKKYYVGKPVDDEDFPYLDTLVSTEYLELYLKNGTVWAKAGRIGRMFANPSLCRKHNFFLKSKISNQTH